MPRTKQSAMTLSRRALLLCGASTAAIALFSREAMASFSLVTQASSNGGPSTAVDTSTANLLVAVVSYDAHGTIGLTDSYNNLWQNGTIINLGGALGLAIFYCLSPTVGPGHTFTSTSTFGPKFCLTAWHTTATVAVDVQNAANSAQPGSVTPGTGTSLIITGATGDINASTASINGGFTIQPPALNNGFSGNTLAQAYLLQSVAASVNPTWSGVGNNLSSVIMVFNTFRTPPPTEAVTFTISASGDITTLSSYHVFDDVTGPNLTYFQVNNTCGGTAADSTHIVLTGVTASVVGHPIQWLSGNKCMCIAFNAGTQIATVSGKGGYSANFGGTPQNGDAYTVFPTQVTFNLGYPSGGGNVWDVSANTGSGANQGMLQFGGTSEGGLSAGVITSPTNYIKLTSSFTFDPTKNLGDITSQPVPCLKGNFDHQSILLIGTQYFYCDHIQFWSQVGPDADGCVQSAGLSNTPGANAPVLAKFTKCLFRNDAFANGNADHYGLLQRGGNFQFDTYIFIDAAWAQGGNAIDATSFIDGTELCTSNLILQATGTTASGASVVTVASTTGISSHANDTTGAYSFWVMHPSIPAGATLRVDSATQFTLRNGDNTGNVVTTAAININDKLYFGPYSMHLFNGSGGSLVTLENLLVCGFCLPTQQNFSGLGLANAITSATDAPVTGTSSNTTQPVPGTSGFIQVDYTVLFNAASGTFTSPDVRLAPGARTLQHGTYRGADVTDFFERPRANPPTIGAQELIVPGGANFFHASPL